MGAGRGGRCLLAPRAQCGARRHALCVGGEENVERCNGEGEGLGEGPGVEHFVWAVAGLSDAGAPSVQKVFFLFCRFVASKDAQQAARAGEEYCTRCATSLAVPGTPQRTAVPRFEPGEGLGGDCCAWPSAATPGWSTAVQIQLSFNCCSKADSGGLFDGQGKRKGEALRATRHRRGCWSGGWCGSARCFSGRPRPAFEALRDAWPAWPVPVGVVEHTQLCVCAAWCVAHHGALLITRPGGRGLSTFAHFASIKALNDCTNPTLKSTAFAHLRGIRTLCMSGCCQATIGVLRVSASAAAPLAQLARLRPGHHHGRVICAPNTESTA